jgi:hypothetical protein
MCGKQNSRRMVEIQFGKVKKDKTKFKEKHKHKKNL